MAYTKHNFKDGDILSASQLNTIDEKIYKIDKLTTFKTPEMFGAVGDGITDDSDAVQAVINAGGLIICAGTYRITKDIYLRNPEINGDTGNFKRSKIIGKSGIISQLDGSAIIDYLQVNQATFYHDGGRFVIKYTCNTEFYDCVFMGHKSHTKTDYAFFAPESPYRRIHIENCTFANLNCAIYGKSEVTEEDENFIWSGENVFKGLYFSLCNYCIVLENGGLDSVFEDMIAQSNCGYFLRLTNASNALIKGNHDYSQNGCVIYACANIIGNYFDGICKLHVKGGTTGGLNGARNSPIISNNNFLLANEATGTKWVIAIDDYLIGGIISNNVIVGGDSARIIMFNTQNATYFYNNVIKNNTGKITSYTSNDLTINKNLYGNDFDKFRVYTDVGTGTKEYEKLFWGGFKSFILYTKVNNPTSFYLRGTSIDKNYSENLVFVEVELQDGTTDKATFIKDGGDLHTAIKNKWSNYSNIKTLTCEIHGNFGYNIPVEAYPTFNYEYTLDSISVSESPIFS